MNPMNWVAGGALVGLLAGCWDKIKAVTWKIISLFIQQVEIPSEAAHHALVAYLIKHCRRSRFYARLYGATYEHHRDGRYGLVPYELFGSRSVVFWQGWWPFVFTNEQENKKPATTSTNPWGGSEETALKIHSTVTFLRGTIDIETILRESCRQRNEQSWTAATEDEKGKNRFFIHYIPKIGDAEHRDESGNSGLAWYQQGHYRLLSHRPDELGKLRTHSGSAVENLIFPQRVKDLIGEIELWRNHKDWYRGKGIPWKRGWLLYGPPGTGKTALARAFAEDLNLPIYVYNLAALSNHTLMQAWSAMQVNVPCIALLEDFDNVFHGRENIARKNGMMGMFLPPKDKDDKADAMPMTPLTFDCLLNCLDGIERSEGVFTVITTNAIEKIDPALGQPRKLPDGTVEFISSRPGRIDKAIELTYMEPADKKRLAQRILGDFPAAHQSMLEFIDKFPDLQETPAQFQERCGQIALACFWKQKHAPHLLEPAPVSTREEDPWYTPYWRPIEEAIQTALAG